MKNHTLSNHSFLQLFFFDCSNCDTSLKNCITGGFYCKLKQSSPPAVQVFFCFQSSVFRNTKNGTLKTGPWPNKEKGPVPANQPHFSSLHLLITDSYQSLYNAQPSDPELPSQPAEPCRRNRTSRSAFPQPLSHRAPHSQRLLQHPHPEYCRTSQYP